MSIYRISGLLLVAALSLGAGKPAPAPVHANWNATIALTPGGGHLLGNPAAPVKLVEYISYTCPHCAHFEVQADGALRVGYIAPGKVSVEVRHMLRDPIDLTVAMLTNCGPPSKFFLNHAAFMRSQSTWIQPLVSVTPAQQQRWGSGDPVTRRRHIATDFHLYQIIATRGYDRITADRCLADQAMAERLAKQAEAGSALGVDSTPSFLLNELLLTGTSDWRSLAPQIDARL
ncbi:MAG TPA: thioredoxin domain-containing protein [Novosphingobium sp.]|nr:thioredoxin domain-containing protein [Novosphingobium sp.]